MKIPPSRLRRVLHRPARLTPRRRVGYLLDLYEVHDFLREILVVQRKLTDRQLARLLER